MDQANIEIIGNVITNVRDKNGTATFMVATNPFWDNNFPKEDKNKGRSILKIETNKPELIEQVMELHRYSRVHVKGVLGTLIRELPCKDHDDIKVPLPRYFVKASEIEKVKGKKGRVGDLFNIEASGTVVSSLFHSTEEKENIKGWLICNPFNRTDRKFRNFLGFKSEDPEIITAAIEKVDNGSKITVHGQILNKRVPIKIYKDGELWTVEKRDTKTNKTRTLYKSVPQIIVSELFIAEAKETTEPIKSLTA